MSETMLTLQDAADAVGGTLVGAGGLAFTRVGSDSRQVESGQLFVALKGERFDGHGFAVQALAAGAMAVLVERGRDWPAWMSRIEVDDTLLALGSLAAHWHQRFAAPLVGITGSNGKTSVKDMLAAILRTEVGDAAVLATAGNLNNQIGVPLMLLRQRAYHRYVVLEMGMNHFGEIRYLTSLARPEVAMITNAGAGHLEFLGSIEGVARAKGEIFEGAASTGTAIFNAEDDHADYWRGLTLGQKVLEFGLDLAAISARNVQLEPLGSRFALSTPSGCAAVELSVPGLHNVRNALAAAAAATALGLHPQAIAMGLQHYAGTKGRLQSKHAANGALVIDDSYNANPNSMRAAIDVLARLPAPRALVLGDMGEIGAEIERHHADIGAYARAAGIERLYATGEQMRRACAAFGEGARWFGDVDTLAGAVRDASGPQSAVLVKGSRFMRMERVVQALIEPAASAAREN